MRRILAIAFASNAVMTTLPDVFYYCQRDATGAQSLQQLRDQRIVVSHFDGEPMALWQFLQKRNQSSEHPAG